MNSIKLRYSNIVFLKEKNFRFYKTKDSFVNLSIDKKVLKVVANENQEFIDLHSIRTNRVLIPLSQSFKYRNSKILCYEVAIFCKNKTAEIKNLLITLIDELCKSFKISKNDKQNLFMLIIRFTNFTRFDQINYYLKNEERIVS